MATYSLVPPLLLASDLDQSSAEVHYSKYTKSETGTGLARHPSENTL
jgi:hypothetical protein